MKLLIQTCWDQNVQMTELFG